MIDEQMYISSTMRRTGSEKLSITELSTTGSALSG
jgi:hypothetical protein